MQRLQEKTTNDERKIMAAKITEKQAGYLVSLVNKATGKSYRFASQIAEDGIGKRMNKVRGISVSEASELITEWEDKVKASSK